MIPALLSILGRSALDGPPIEADSDWELSPGMESAMGYPGWETFLHSSYRKGSKPFLSTGTVIWVCILLMSVIVPILFRYFGFASSTASPHQPG